MPKDRIYEEVRNAIMNIINNGADKKELSRVLSLFAESVSNWADYEK